MNLHSLFLFFYFFSPSPFAQTCIFFVFVFTLQQCWNSLNFVFTWRVPWHCEFPDIMIYGMFSMERIKWINGLISELHTYTMIRVRGHDQWLVSEKISARTERDGYMNVNAFWTPRQLLEWRFILYFSIQFLMDVHSLFLVLFMHAYVCVCVKDNWLCIIQCRVVDLCSFILFFNG